MTCRTGQLLLLTQHLTLRLFRHIPALRNIQARDMLLQKQTDRSMIESMTLQIKRMGGARALHHPCSLEIPLCKPCVALLSPAFANAAHLLLAPALMTCFVSIPRKTRADAQNRAAELHRHIGPWSPCHMVIHAALSLGKPPAVPAEITTGKQGPRQSASSSEVAKQGSKGPCSSSVRHRTSCKKLLF